LSWELLVRSSGLKIFHISDLHFQADIPLGRIPRLHWRRIVAQTEFRLLGRRKRFARVAETVGKLLDEADRLGADHILASGDFTALALPEEFASARSALSRWRGRLTVIPGNHDRYTPGAARQLLFEGAFPEDLSSDLPEHRREGAYPLVKFIGADAAIVGLSSARVPLMPGVALGWVGAAQREGLAAALSDLKKRGRGAIVAVHHGPFRPSGRPDRPTHGLVDAAKVMATAAEGGAVALCHGHIHHRYRVSGPAGLPIFCAGSSTQAGMEGYWLFDVGATGLRSAQAVKLVL
jgi:3',5'-cyclic AMP phosphodiesterase CpdA